MGKALSLYLNLMRALAALAVYLFHAQHFSKLRVPVIGNLGNEAVIVFFVLSGLLITGSALRQKALGLFLQARLARLWSVALPALGLTMVADLFGQYLSLASYYPMMPYSPFKWIASLGINALFLNQVWDLNIFPGTNGVFWSLSYEFWYYVIFAAFFYFRGKTQIVAVACSLLIAGPSIVIGLPIWALGAVTYLAVKRIKPHSMQGWGWGLWLGSFLIMLLWGSADLDMRLAAAFPDLMENAKWPVDFWPASYLIGIITAANIYGFAHVGHRFTGILDKASPVISFGADISFGLYLFHYPLMYLSRAVCNSLGLVDGGLFIGILYVIPFVLSVGLASYFERSKDKVAHVISRIADKMDSYRHKARTGPFITAWSDDLHEPDAVGHAQDTSGTKP